MKKTMKRSLQDDEIPSQAINPDLYFLGRHIPSSSNAGHENSNTTQRDVLPPSQGLFMTNLSTSICPNINTGDGYKLIHNACRYFPQNIMILDMILNLDPSSIKSPVENCCDQPVEIKQKKSSEETSSVEELNGSYPLHILLAHGGSYETVNLLISREPSIVRLRDASGRTPLIVALQQKCSAEIIKLLLSIDDSVIEVADNNKNFPLHIACENECPADVTEWLVLKYPLAVDLRNADMKTPLELAQLYGYLSDKVLTMLKETALW